MATMQEKLQNMIGVREGNKKEREEESEKTKSLLNLAEAAGSGNLDQVRNIVERFKQEVDVPEALYLASKGGHHDVVSLLVSNGYAQYVNTPFSGETCLIAAARGGHLATIKELVERGLANVNAASDTDGMVAHHHAIVNGHIEAVRYLLGRDGLVIDTTNNKKGGSGETKVVSLILACENGRADIVNLLLSAPYSIDINAHGGAEGYTALHAAAKTGNAHVLGLLLLHDRVDTEILDKEGRVPLQYALRAGSRIHALVKHLFELHAQHDAAGIRNEMNKFQQEVPAPTAQELLKAAQEKEAKDKADKERKEKREKEMKTVSIKLQNTVDNSMRRFPLKVLLTAPAVEALDAFWEVLGELEGNEEEQGTEKGKEKGKEKEKEGTNNKTKAVRNGTLKYQDADEDMVTIASADEFLEAVKHVLGTSPTEVPLLRLYFTPK